MVIFGVPVTVISVYVSLLQEQYKLIHDTVLVYLESFDTYANFKNVV